MKKAGRPRHFVIQESAEALYLLYRQANDLRLRRRYQVLWLLKRGFTYDQTAIEAGLARANVQKVVSWYRTEGLQGMEKHPRGGARTRKTRLTPEQTQALEEECRTGKFLHSGQIAQWLWLTFRVVFSDSGLRRCLYRLNMSWKTMRPLHPLRSEEWALLWKEVLFAYFSLPYRGQFIFFDEMRLGLLGQSRRAWGQKGLRLPQKKQMSYQWVYLALWLDPLTHEIGWTWMANMKAQSLLEVMQNWPRRFGAVIWDRAPSHRARMLKQLPIGRIELPPYSPDLNPVERIFEEVRRNVEGKQYRSLDEKKEAVESYLKGLNSDQIKSLTNWDYIESSIQAA